MITPNPTPTPDALLSPANEALLYEIAEQNPDGALLIDDNGRIFFANQAAGQLFNRPPGQLTNQLFGFPLIDGKLTEIELVGDANNLNVWRVVEMRATQIAWNGRQMWLASLRDVTLRKQTEARLRQMQKLESLGLMAGGVAHDFNNLLTAMLGQASLALSKLPADHPAYGNVEKAILAARHAADLTEQLLAYSGGGQLTAQRLDLNKLIQENLHLFTAGVSKQLYIQLQLAPDLPLIEGDAGQINQVVMNLLLNGAEAIGDRAGQLLIRTQALSVKADEHYPIYLHDEKLPPGDYAALTVSDNGVGMTADTAMRIFDPFYTTKFTGRGLGLAVVMGIVNSHKGGIHVASELGQGASFTLYFPASGQYASDEQTAEAPILPPTAKMVLVIDDEPFVRQAVSDVLSEEKITVLLASDGYEGLHIYRERQKEIGLVLLDFSMPGMDGEKTFNELRQIDPEARVILSSGYSETGGMRRILDNGCLGFIKKPYNINTLIDMVQEHLA
jgi:signal transduction histidine kinase/CheY-like chemotaxis protein